jgi:hypothetical protein
MIRHEPEMAATYAKDATEERFLRDLNDVLAAWQPSQPVAEAVYPQLIVAGTPRSGSTLLMQLMASCLDVGYVDNLVASFWRAPVVGVRLSRKLLDKPAHPSYASNFGRTRGIDQPHEFGYFWSEMLGYPDFAERDPEHEDRIDWIALRNTLRSMAVAFGAPMVSKPFLLTWHLARFAAELPETVFVRIKRDPVDAALSMLRLREELLGTRDAWASLKPKEGAWLEQRSVHEQVAGQIHYLDASISAQLARVPADRVLEIAFDELCTKPGDALAAIRQLLRRHGAEVDLLREAPDAFPVSRPSERRPQDAAAVEKAFVSFDTPAGAPVVGRSP